MCACSVHMYICKCVLPPSPLVSHNDDKFLGIPNWQYKKCTLMKGTGRRVSKAYTYVHIWVCATVGVHVCRDGCIILLYFFVIGA